MALNLRICAPLLAVLLLSPAQAAVEPMTLTSGGIFYSRSNQAEFRPPILGWLTVEDLCSTA